MHGCADTYEPGGRRSGFVPRSGIFRNVAIALIIAFGYYTGTIVGLLFTPPGRVISILWPANAVLFAGLVLSPFRIWPLILAAVLPVHMLIQLRTGIPELVAIGWFFTNTAEAMLGAVMLRAISSSREIPITKLLRSSKGVAYFIVLGVLVAPFLTSFLDASVVVHTGFGRNFWVLWRHRFLSDMLAALTFAPPIIVLFSMEKPSGGGKKYGEALLLAAAIVLVAGIVLGVRNYSVAALIYLILPLLLWAAVRFGSGGTSASLLLVAVLVSWNAIHGRGPFAALETQVLSLQTFLCAMSVTLLFLAAVFEERRDIEEELRHHQSLASLVSQIAARFVNVSWDEIDQEVSVSLNALLNFLRVDRVSVFDLADDELVLRQTALREGVIVPAPARIAATDAHWLLNEMRSGRPIFINDFKEIAKYSAHLERLSLARMRSIAIVPVGAQDSVLGILTIVSTSKQRALRPDLLPQLEILGEIFHDAIQRAKAFHALAESEQRFRHTADSSPMLIWMSGTDGSCNYFNEGWLQFTGVSLEKQLGNGWAELVHPDDFDRCLSTYATAFSTREKFSMEYRIRRYDDEYRWILDIGMPRFDAHGTFVGYIGSAVDISERKNAERAAAELSGRLLKAQEEERRRIARELHDDVGQRVTLLSIELDRLQNSPEECTNNTIVELLYQATAISECVHNMSHNLHSAALDVLPLTATLRRLCKEFGEKAGVEVLVDERGVPSALPLDVKLCLYRVAQEALQNVAKHSEASCAVVELVSDEIAGQTLSIEDDGVGFDTQARDSGLGLASMRERLRSVGGTINISSSPGRGTRLEAHVPLRLGLSASHVKAA